jgi:multisubunit Na+/H+ antiporter MnhB subunit
MRTTGLGFSAVLVIVGAILAWAVTTGVEGIDLHLVGLIMFVVGIVLAAITLAAGALGQRRVVEHTREGVVNGQPVQQHERDVVVDHNQTI